MKNYAVACGILLILLIGAGIVLLAASATTAPAATLPQAPPAQPAPEPILAGWLFELGDGNAIFVNYNPDYQRVYNKAELAESFGADPLPQEKPLISMGEAQEIAVNEKNKTGIEGEVYWFGVFCYKHSKYDIGRSEYKNNFWAFPVKEGNTTNGWTVISDYSKHLESAGITDASTRTLIEEMFSHDSREALKALAEAIAYAKAHNANTTFKGQVCMQYVLTKG